MRANWLAGVGLAFCMVAATRAAEFKYALGTLGELEHWLVIEAPGVPFDQDPFAAMGGETNYAAMAEPRLAPYAGNALEIPGAEPEQKVRIGNAVWVYRQMVSPDMPGIWNEYPRLEIPQNVRYAYCRLDSPREMKGGLLLGSNRGKYRVYFNGRELGTFDGGSGWEYARELPVDIRQGANHLFVRFMDAASFACRLVGENAEPLREVKVSIGANSAPKWTVDAPVTPENRKFVNLAKEIPPLAPPARPEFLGAKLARTMALLESGKYTHRPVRIIYSGQSIETDWTRMLIQNLRDRYPGTTIIAENRAIGGWFVWRMQKLIKHDILRWKPDLVLFSAYQGTAEVWERFISELRSETAADIVIRTQHIGGKENVDDPREGPETIMLRRLAQKYDVELVEVRREWLDYLQANAMVPMDLLRDGIHLNAKGEILMALLYERHFRYNAASRQGWADTVRRFDVGRFLEDGHSDEIILKGAGWSGGRFAKSNSADDRLKLRFYGTRVDLVMPTTHGSAQVLIDGRKPSELNLYYGTRPVSRAMNLGAPNVPMTYHLGAGMQEETWVLRLTEGNADEDPKKANLRVKFTLTGSRTGFDGEGWNDRKFVSNSGRITLLPSDWQTMIMPPAADKPAPEMKPLAWNPQIVWHILPTSLDTVPPGPGWVKDTDYYCGQPYEYVTVADGLPCGVHDLTLIPIPEPNPYRVFTIVGVDVYRPPLARDASHRTVSQ